MALTASLRSRAKAHPRAVTAVLSVVGYALVAAVFLGVAPLPTLSRGTTILFGDVIAVVNTAALTALLAGVYFVRRRRYDRHRTAMLAAFALILLFLVVYLWKVGGGFEKAFVVPAGAPLAAYGGLVKGAYLVMLLVHILLSVVAVPVVLHAVVLGTTHSTRELRDTEKMRVGRVAAAAWILSLALGIVTYLLLNHVYAWEPLHRGALFVVAPAARAWRADEAADGRSLTRARGG